MNKNNIKILVLDDEEQILASIKRLLMAEGYSVVTYNKPEDAINHIRNEVVHIALLDILLPNMDGITTLNIMKEISGLTQIIMMSAYSTVDRIVSALESWANDFMIKPFDSSEHLVELVNKSVEKLERWQGVLKEAGAV